MSFQFSDEQIFKWMESSVQKLRADFIENSKDTYKTFLKRADPFSLIIVMASLDLDKSKVLEKRPIEKAEKTYMNYHGKQWENLILLKEDWEVPNELLDVARKDKSIVVEMKNRHDSVTQGKLSSVYDDMEKCLRNEYDLAVYTYIIPKNEIKIDRPFTPSDAKTKEKRPVNKKIREMDGETFFNKYIFEDNNGFKNFLDQFIQVSRNFSSIFSDEENQELIKDIRNKYNI